MERVMKLKPVGGNMILSDEERREKTLDTRPSGVFGTPGNEQSGIFPEGWEERLKESENKIKQAVRFEEKKTPPQSIREPKTYEFPAANNAVLSPVTKEKIAQDKKTLMDITSKDWATRYIFDPLTSNIKELRPLNKFLTAPAKITDEERRNLTPQQLRERQEEISLLEASGATRLYEKMSSYERMVYDEKQRESYYYEKEFDDALAAAIKADPKDFELKEGYEEPTSAVGMFIEDIKYSKHGFLDIAMSKSLEANLRMIGAGPDVLEWAEKIAINAKIDLLRRPELFAPEGLDMGDARWWTSTLANQVTFWATVFAASAGGAIVGSIAGTGAAGGAMTGGYLMGAGIEQGMAYDAMTEQGISPWEADWGSMVYGAAASYIENALGTKPGTVLSSMLKKNAVRSFKKTTLKGLMEKGAIKALMVAKTAGEEGLEEIVQGFTQNLVSSWFDENQALFTKDLWEQFKGGLAGGLLFGVIGAGGGASFKSLTIEEIGRVLPNELTSAQMGIQNELTNLKESIDKEGVDREFVVKKMVELKDSFNEIEAGKDRILKVGLTIEDITQKTFKNLTPRQQAIATDMIVLMEDVGKEGITKESVAKRLKQLRTEFNLIEENKRDMPSLGLTIKDVNKGKPIEEIKPKKSVIPKELQPLATEAKKFDSAEEFFLRMDKGVRDLLVNQGIRSQEAIKNFWNNNVEKVVQKIDSVNPTGSLYVDYKPQERMTLELGENMTTLDKTSGKSSDEMITVYRGAPKIQKEIVPGDFITTNYELAKSYTGEDNILEKEVRMGDILDDIKEPLGEEYIYRPQATKEVKPVTKEIIPSQFFDRKFKEPGLAKYITPGNRYARSLGVYDLVEPSIKANTALQLERAKQFKNLDKIERAIYKIEKVKIPEKIAKAVIRKTPQRIRGWYNMLDKYDTAKEAGLTGEKAEIFTELRSLTKGMLERTNEVRTEVGLEPIRNIKGYITHIFDMATKKALSKMYSMPEVTKYWTDFTRSKHIYNPTAFHRLASDPRGLLRDPIAALRTMVSVDLKQIYMEQPNQLYREQMNKLEDVIPASTRKWVDSYMDVAIKGRPTEFDKLTNASLEKLGVRKALDLILKPFGRTSSSNLAVSMANGLSRLIHDAVIWGKVRLVLRNHTQKFLNLGMYGTKAFVKASFPAPKALKETIKDSDFWKISNRSFVETQVGLGKGVIKKLENLGYKPYGHSHISNVNHAMKTAYYAGKELVDNPKYAKLGWTMDDVAREMEHGAMSTQYWYNKMGMPEIFRSGAGKILMTLQSWWMNYTANYWREMLVRGFTGKTGWGKSIPVKWRLASIRHIITSLIFIEGMRKAFDLEYRQIALLGVLPTYLSPPGQMVLGLYNYLFAGDDDWKRKKAINQMKYSWKSFLPGSGAWKEWSGLWSGKKTLKETLFYTGKKEEPKTSSSVSNGTSRYGEAKSIGKSRY